MSNQPKLTPLQRKALTVLLHAGGSHIASTLAAKITPSQKGGWKPQGSVRWCAGYFRHLEAKGLTYHFQKDFGGDVSFYTIALTKDGFAIAGDLV